MSSPSAHPSAFGTSSLGDARVRGREAHGLCGTGRVPGHHHPLPLYNLLERPRQVPGWKPAERRPDTEMIPFAACDRGGRSQQAAAGGPGLVRRVSAAIPRPQPALFCLLPLDLPRRALWAEPGGGRGSPCAPGSCRPPQQRGLGPLGCSHRPARCLRTLGDPPSQPHSLTKKYSPVEVPPGFRSSGLVCALFPTTKRPFFFFFPS